MQKNKPVQEFCVPCLLLCIVRKTETGVEQETSHRINNF